MELNLTSCSSLAPAKKLDSPICVSWHLSCFSLSVKHCSFPSPSPLNRRGQLRCLKEQVIYVIKCNCSSKTRSKERHLTFDLAGEGHCWSWQEKCQWKDPGQSFIGVDTGNNRLFGFLLQRRAKMWLFCWKMCYSMFLHTGKVIKEDFFNAAGKGNTLGLLFLNSQSEANLNCKPGLTVESL